jgi:hypothetical protein
MEPGEKYFDLPCETCISFPICRQKALEERRFPICDILSKYTENEIRPELFKKLNRIYIFQFFERMDHKTYNKLYISRYKWI